MPKKVPVPHCDKVPQVHCREVLRPVHDEVCQDVPVPHCHKVAHEVSVPYMGFGVFSTGANGVGGGGGLLRDFLFFYGECKIHRFQGGQRGGIGWVLLIPPGGPDYPLIPGTYVSVKNLDFSKNASSNCTFFEF